MDAEFVGLVINIAVIIWKIVIQFGITTAWVPPNRFAINSLISCVNDPIQVPENRRNWFYFRINLEGGARSIALPIELQCEYEAIIQLTQKISIDIGHVQRVAVSAMRQ